MAKLFSRAVSLYIPTTSLSTFSTTFGIVTIFNSGCSNRYVVIFHHFLISLTANHVDVFSYAYPYIFFGEMSVHFFCLTSNCIVFVFVTMSFECSLYILDASPVSDTGLKIFPSNVYLVFSSP